MKTRPINTPENWDQLAPHPLSQLIGFGKGISVEAMADHMRTHGYDDDEPVILFEGMILDGRHRHAACKMVGNSPPFREFCGKDASAYVAKKLFRQYPTVAERARMAAMYANLPGGRPAETSSNDEVIPQMTNAQAAKTFGVSESSVSRAKAEVGKDRILCPSCTTRVRKSQPVEPKCRECRTLRAAAKADKGNNQDADTPEPAPKAEPMDDLGNKLPKKIRDAWAGNQKGLGDSIKLLFAIRKTIKGLSNWNAWLRCGEMELNIGKFVEDMKNGLPYAVHEACEGKGCKECRNQGWVPKWKHAEVKK